MSIEGKSNLELSGQSLSIGVAVGDVLLVEQYEHIDVPIHRIKESDINSEILRYHDAVESCQADLQRDLIRVAKNLGRAQADIFDAHIAILSDPTLEKEIVNNIRENLENVEAVVWKSSNKYEKMFKLIEDEYVREKVFDIREVCQRILNKLLFIGSYCNYSKQVILVAKRLTPTLVANRDWSNVLGLIAEKGSITSHMAIMVRALGVPSVIKLPEITKKLKNGEKVIVDGQLGKVIVRPSETKLFVYNRVKHQFNTYHKKLKKNKAEPTKTQDGVSVKLLANIGRKVDIPIAMEYNLDGVGLFRTEFFFMSSSVSPSQETQRKYYTSVAEKCQGKEVVIRLLDVGADKNLPFIKLPPQANPSLASRGIRIIDYYPDIFITQVKALLIAAYYHPIKILLPMVSNIKEIYKFKELLLRCSEELKKEKKNHSLKVSMGIMVEVPSIIFSLDSILPLVDFLSIGTNDLTQYLLAADRFDENMSSYYLPHDPSVFKAIAKISEAGEYHGVPVTVCGEIAGNPKFTKALIGMGIRSLSLVPHNALFIKDIIAKHSIEECMRHSDTIMGLSNADAIESFIESDYSQYLANLNSA